MIGKSVTVGTTATQIVPEETSGRAGQGDIGYPTASIIRFPSAMSATVYLGGSDVDLSTNGCPFVAGEDLEIDLVGDILYAIAASPQTIYILRRS